ncbi:DUF4129 domain-containing protein [uncultured Paludibaculum sp.]|uniref:DUF4129 domain-containing protein n=1 Tax=uncultured Paludibaculum sp. TaxID=1765020 RepID=UPI002AAB9528|nr:DUF4129 domain-containing protein [uncultured Paludibaculum sp.]
MRAWSQLWLLLLAAAASPAQQRPADLAADLRRWSAVVEEGKPFDPNLLPEAWSVGSPDALYSISTAPLKAHLQSGSKDHRAVRAWLELLAASLDDSNPVQWDPSAAEKLSRILARPEFRPPAPPSNWDLWWRALGRSIQAILDRLFAFTGSHPSSIQVFLWVLLIGSSGFLVYLLMRSWRHEQRTGPLSPGRLPELSLNSGAWVAAAHSARRQGDIARSIQCCYWAGVTHLQAAGTLPPHFAHTPREYLRLLSGKHELRAALGVLCTRLEHCWYARATPDDQDLASCLVALKELGCSVD